MPVRPGGRDSSGLNGIVQSSRLGATGDGEPRGGDGATGALFGDEGASAPQAPRSIATVAAAAGKPEVGLGEVMVGSLVAAAAASCPIWWIELSTG